MAESGARPIVAVGGSAGGVQALKTLVGMLPPDLPAPVLVALHMPVTDRTYLTEILARRTSLEVVTAADGLVLRPGLVVVARPDLHLLAVDGRIALGRGARENGSRPSHDAMLRSVGLAYGRDAVGVVLTGLLDDGAAGLGVVSRYGGVALVQDPAEAEFPSMPEAALRAVRDARALPLAALVEEVVRAVSDSDRPTPDVDKEQRLRDEAELASAFGDSPALPDGQQPGEPSPYSCPDCSGVLRHIPDEHVLRFRCRTGHAWSAESLVAQMDDEVERALWTALRVLEERAQMSGKLAVAASRDHRAWSEDHFIRRAQEAEQSAGVLRAVLQREADLPSLPSPSELA